MFIWQRISFRKNGQCSEKFGDLTVSSLSNQTRAKNHFALEQFLKNMWKQRKSIKIRIESLSGMNFTRFFVCFMNSIINRKLLWKFEILTIGSFQKISRTSLKIWKIQKFIFSLQIFKTKNLLNSSKMKLFQPNEVAQTVKIFDLRLDDKMLPIGANIEKIKKEKGWFTGHFSSKI